MSADSIKFAVIISGRSNERESNVEQQDRTYDQTSMQKLIIM